MIFYLFLAMKSEFDLIYNFIHFDTLVIVEIDMKKLLNTRYIYTVQSEPS